MTTRKAVISVILLFVVGHFTIVSVDAADFSSAMGSALINIPPGADVSSMGNAWTATPNFSSNNPAVLAAGEEHKVIAEGTYGIINLKHNGDLRIHSESLSAKLPVGVLQLNYSDVTSGKIKNGSNTDFKITTSPAFDFSYGLKLGGDVLRTDDNIFMGIGYTYYDYKEKNWLSGQQDLESKTKGNSYYMGLLYQPSETITLGAFYSFTREKNSDHFLLLNEKEHDASTINLVRAGLGWKILPETFMAVDYQYLDNGKKKSQVFAGIEQGIIKELLYAYAGWAGDGPTAGLGVYFKNGGLNVAYMHNAFDLKPFIGRADMIIFSAYYKF